MSKSALKKCVAELHSNDIGDYSNTSDSFPLCMKCWSISVLFTVLVSICGFSPAAQGYVAEEITSNGQHAIRFRAKKLLFTGDSDLLRENMFEKDTSGYFDLTLHTGQYSHCDKCVKIKVSQKEVIVAGAVR